MYTLARAVFLPHSSIFFLSGHAILNVRNVLRLVGILRAQLYAQNVGNGGTHHEESTGSTVCEHLHEEPFCTPGTKLHSTQPRNVTWADIARGAAIAVAAN